MIANRIGQDTLQSLPVRVQRDLVPVGDDDLAVLPGGRGPEAPYLHARSKSLAERGSRFAARKLVVRARG